MDLNLDNFRVAQAVRKVDAMERHIDFLRKKLASPELAGDVNFKKRQKLETELREGEAELDTRKDALREAQEELAKGKQLALFAEGV